VLAIVVGNVVNALLDWVLIHGHLGLPALRRRAARSRPR
jgi:Na+-driven multidrug efflux pump